MYPNTKLAKAFSAEIGFALFNLAKPFECHRNSIRDPGRQAWTRRAVPRDQSTRLAANANVLFRKTDLGQRTSHISFCRRNSAGPLVEDVVRIRAIQNIKDAPRI